MTYLKSLKLSVFDQFSGEISSKVLIGDPFVTKYIETVIQKSQIKREKQIVKEYP